MNTLKKYDLILYDLWGNEEDGYDCNDSHCIERGIEIFVDASDTDILKIVNASEGVTICPHSSDDFIEFLNTEGYPCGRLQLTE